MRSFKAQFNVVDLLAYDISREDQPLLVMSIHS